MRWQIRRSGPVPLPRFSSLCKTLGKAKACRFLLFHASRLHLHASGGTLSFFFFALSPSCSFCRSCLVPSPSTRAYRVSDSARPCSPGSIPRLITWARKAREGEIRPNAAAPALVERASKTSPDTSCIPCSVFSAHIPVHVGRCTAACVLDRMKLPSVVLTTLACPSLGVLRVKRRGHHWAPHSACCFL